MADNRAPKGLIIAFILALVLCLGLLGVMFFTAQGAGIPSLKSLIWEEEAAVNLTSTPAPSAEPTETPTPTPEITPEPTEAPTPTPVPDSDITLRFVGDIMCHDRQLASALQEDGSYDMTPWFSSISASISCADLAIGNLETVFAGEEEGYTGFPSFNSPDAYATALKAAGFDILTFANNHTYDQRIDGIRRTLNVLKENGLLSTGACGQQDDFEDLLIMNVKGIKVGILAYSSVFNSTPKSEWMVRKLSRGVVEDDVKQLRREGADYIVCMVHWGAEYEEHYGSTQKQQAQMLAECGVDAIFGSHPHVVQEAEMLTVERDGAEVTVPVAYSMGNFISNQQDRPRDMGIIFELQLKKSGETGEISLTQAGYVPTVVYRGDSNGKDTYEVLPCGTYMNSDHEKAHRCETVWEYEAGLMSEDFVELEK